MFYELPLTRGVEKQSTSRFKKKEKKTPNVQINYDDVITLPSKVAPTVELFCRWLYSLPRTPIKQTHFRGDFGSIYMVICILSIWKIPTLTGNDS